MRDLAKRRIQIAERLFDAYEFGIWNLEEVSHWHAALAGEELCRSIMLCGAELGAPCLRGEFIVRFKTRSTLVLERYATVDGCIIGDRTKAAVRKVGSPVIPAGCRSLLLPGARIATLAGK